tara:strand:- start:9745 stop:10419 length:675 start_codon:yes stop_codon:yes gene_type:complete
MSIKTPEEKTFTPALGYSFLTPLYDSAIAALTRESLWRGKMIEQLNPAPHERILDVGCGTGSLVTQIKSLSLLTQVIGLDPDPEVLEVAKNKANRKNLEIDWKEGFLSAERVSEIGPVCKIVSSLVFHQTPLDEKRRMLKQMFSVLKTDGELCIADYGLQRTKLMRLFFKATVQQLDGFRDTQPNADGVLPGLIEEAGFSQVEELEVIPTITGSISIYTGRKIV